MDGLIHSGVVEWFVGAGVLIGGLGYVVGQFLNGRGRASKETIALMSQQIEALQKIAGDNSREIKELLGEVNRLRGVIQEKDNKLKEYLTILQDRDPELKQMMKKLTDVLETMSAYPCVSRPRFPQSVKLSPDVI